MEETVIEAQTPIAETVQQPIAQQLTAEGSQVAKIVAMAQSNPEFAKQPEVAAILAKVNEFKTANTPAPAAKPAKQADKKPDGNGQAEDEGVDDPDEKTTKSVFFAKKKDDDAFEVKSMEDFEKAAKKFGVENVSDFWKAVPKWRDQAKKADEFEKKATQLENFIADFPEDLYEAAQLWANGGDYKAPFKSAGVDFSKSFDKQKDVLVNHYFPNQFTEEELSAPDKVVQGAIDIAKEKFEFEKGKVQDRRADIDRKAGIRAEALKASVNSSVKALEDSFPDMSAKEKSEIRKIMVGGDVSHVFLNKDGSFKTDAAKRIALALYGEQEIQARVSGATKKAGNRQKMEEVEKKPEKPVSGNAASQQAELPDDIKSAYSGWNQGSVYDSRPPQQQK